MYVVEVLLISVEELKSDEAELCHFIMEPVCPLKVSKVLFVPEQTAVEPLMLPATVNGLTVIVPDALTEPHPPVSGML